MNDSLILLSIYISGIFFLAVAMAGMLLWRGTQRRREIGKAMNLGLLAVRLPLAVAGKEETASVERMREKIAVMEQLYSSFSSWKPKSFFAAKPWLACELAVSASGNELAFYIAAPRQSADGMEKLVHAYYPDAIVEHTNDYNIFSPTGQVAYSSASLKNGQLLSLRTYRNLESDPLRAIASVFTKLHSENEGASFQLLFRPAPKKWHKQIMAEAERYYKGEKHKDDGVGAILKTAFVGADDKKKKEAEEPKSAKRTPIDEARGKSLEDKASKPLFETNMRLVASAQTRERASAILQSLEQAFLQFADPNLNSLVFSREKERRVKKAVFRYAFRLFDSSKLMILSPAELTSIYHFPNTPIEVPGVENVRSRESAPPSDAASTGLLLGFNIFRGVETPIRIGREDRRRHLYLIGQTGTGKSNLLKTLIAQDIQNGEGVCVIDPHGDLPEYALGFVPEHRMDDVIYFDPGDTARPMAMNMLEYDPRYPEQKTLLINELLAIFEKLFNMSVAGGPAFEQYFRNATQLVMDDPESGNTLIDVARIFKDKAFREYKLSRTTNPLVKSFWTEIAERSTGEQSLANYAPYITNKFDVFLSSDILRPIIAQQHSTINFREVMDQKKILLINLSKGRLGEISSNLLGLILVGKLLLASFSRTDIADENERKDFYVYIDEFQNVTTKSIATILSEARKYRLSLTITHQFIGQLEEEIKKAVFGNVGSMGAFRIGAEDAEFLETQFGPEFTRQDLISLDNYRLYLKFLTNGKISRPFSMRTNRSAESNKAVALRVKELSRQKFGRPRAEVEAEILKQHN